MHVTGGSLNALFVAVEPILGQRDGRPDPHYILGMVLVAVACVRMEEDAQITPVEREKRHDLGKNITIKGYLKMGYRMRSLGCFVSPASDIDSIPKQVRHLPT